MNNEDRAALESGLSQKTTLEVYDDLVHQMEMVPMPKGYGLCHKRGSLKHKFFLWADDYKCEMVPEMPKKPIETFDQFKRRDAKRYQGVVDTIIEAIETFGVTVY